ncbi:MAG: hypothetical protein ACYTEE_03260 [Planctomycetota bacterium]|jgi:hypothetical protein
MARTGMPHLGHTSHLCYLVNIDFPKYNLDDYKYLVRNPKFICKACARTAASGKNLCEPEPLNEQ